MIIVEKISGKLAEGESRRVERVALGWEDRLRSRQRVTSDGGSELGIALPTGRHLHQDDILYEDGERVIAVAAIPEPVLALYPESEAEMGRLAYQIGNRHAPISVQEGRLLTPYDKVLADYFEEHPGDLNLHRGDAPFALYAARTASVMQELTAAGLEPDRVGVVESAPGGDGISSLRLVRILEKGEDGGAGISTGPMPSMTEGGR